MSEQGTLWADEGLPSRLGDGDEEATASLAERIAGDGGDLTELLAGALSDSDDEVAPAHAGVKPRYDGDDLFSGTGSAPLPNRRWERFAEEYVARGNAAQAYRLTISAHCLAKTAASQASRLLRRPEVRARVRWLSAQNRRVQLAGADASSAPMMTREDKVAHLETMIRSPSATPSDRIRAIAEHTRLTAAGAGGRRPPDPAYLAQYLRAAGAQGVAATAAEGEDTGSSGGAADGLRGGDPTRLADGEHTTGCGSADFHSAGAASRPVTSLSST